jgi:alkylation response protein AidB-like acyl-CoA dehydrogenase
MPSVRRQLFDDEHEAFRESVGRFLEREIAPHHEAWERAGIVPREAFAAAGAGGFLGMAIPEEYGGAGVDDFRFNAIIGEEAHRLGLAGFSTGVTLHNDVCLPYLLHYADEPQRERWLPGVANGELVTAIAMTEPGTGSDLAAIATTAQRDGDGYRLNGAKTFITNGINADLVIVAARAPGGGRGRLSLLVVEREQDGFERGRKLEKIGLHSQDTAELFFSDALVPAENLLGREGEAFGYLTANLAQERLSIAASAVAAASAALADTVAYVVERSAFGQRVADFQHTRFALAEMATEIDVGRAYADRCIEALVAGELSASTAAMAKLWCTEMQGRVLDRCVQLFGGYGYMREYRVARAWTEARVTRIYGGTNEVMKEIVARDLLPARG